MTETQQPLVRMTEDEWSDKYKPVGMERDGSGTITRDAHEIPPDVEDSHLWTLVEGDRGEYFIPGWHRVNHIAFVVTQNPWEHLNIEVEMDGPDFSDEEDGAPCCPAPQDHDTKDGTCDFPGYADNH